MNCGVPEILTPGITFPISPAMSTEGATAGFQCVEGFLLASSGSGNITLQCTSSGLWMPDPITLVCTGEQKVYHLFNSSYLDDTVQILMSAQWVFIVAQMNRTVPIPMEAMCVVVQRDSSLTPTILKIASVSFHHFRNKALS